MRLGRILFQINQKRHFERIWKKQGRLQATELRIPQELQDMGVFIRDAREILNETKLFQTVKHETVRPVPPSVFYSPKYYFVMNEKTQISESKNQILSLTKSISLKSLPEQILSLIGTCNMADQDEAVQNCVLQSHEWDGDQDKLPKRIDPEMPGYNFKRSYGTLHEKKVSGLLERLTYLCNSAISRYPLCLARDQVLDAFGELPITRYDENITFQMVGDILMTSNKPLSRFSSAKEVFATSKLEVPNIYPIKPTLDLNKFEEKPLCNPIPQMPLQRFIHTIWIGHKNHKMWNLEELKARCIGTCFAFCAKEAVMKYGNNVQDLPEPVCVQCVLVNGQSLYFAAYQLNTLALKNDDGIKNQVWMEEDEVHATEALPKLFALSVNGLIAKEINS